MNIGEHIGEVVAALREEEDGAPYYMYGHRAELSARLEAMDKSAIAKTKKYPLIILILDIPAQNDGDMVRYNLHLALMTFVKGEANAEQIITTTFDATLQPLYESFIEALVDSGKFQWPGDPWWPTHTAFDRPRWGLPGNEKNEAQYFNDAVDAIEVVNLELNMERCRETTTIRQYDALDGTVVFIGDYNLDSGIITIPSARKGWQYRILLTDAETPVVIDGEQLWHGSIIQAMMPAPGNDFTTGWIKIK